MVEDVLVVEWQLGLGQVVAQQGVPQHLYSLEGDSVGLPWHSWMAGSLAQVEIHQVTHE
jgi:hypothetical protein